MVDKVWTDEEIKEFDKLVDMASSRNQVTRIDGRLKLNEFKKTHGKEKCQAMWDHLEGNDENQNKKD